MDCFLFCACIKTMAFLCIPSNHLPNVSLENALLKLHGKDFIFFCHFNHISEHGGVGMTISHSVQFLENHSFN